MLDGDSLVRNILGNKNVDLKDSIESEVAKKVVERINDKKLELVGKTKEEESTEEK